MDGDYLRATDGRVVLVKAAAERLTEASTSDPVLFAKICYHLGNRHTPVEIQPGSFGSSQTTFCLTFATSGVCG